MGTNVTMTDHAYGANQCNAISMTVIEQTSQFNYREQDLLHRLYEQHMQACCKCSSCLCVRGGGRGHVGMGVGGCVCSPCACMLCVHMCTCYSYRLSCLCQHLQTSTFPVTCPQLFIPQCMPCNHRVYVMISSGELLYVTGRLQAD